MALLISTFALLSSNELFLQCLITVSFSDVDDDKDIQEKDLLGEALFSLSSYAALDNKQPLAIALTKGGKPLKPGCGLILAAANVDVSAAEKTLADGKAAGEGEASASLTAAVTAAVDVNVSVNASVTADSKEGSVGVSVQAEASAEVAAEAKASAEVAAKGKTETSAHAAAEEHHADSKPAEDKPKEEQPKDEQPKEEAPAAADSKAAHADTKIDDKPLEVERTKSISMEYEHPWCSHIRLSVSAR